MAAEMTSALVFLHSAPEAIIHMDLKPGNILLNKSLISKVGDVGLSRLAPSLVAGPGGHISTVQDTKLVGTPAYMDPEYARTGRFGPKSDVYSLGRCWSHHPPCGYGWLSGFTFIGPAPSLLLGASC